MGSVCAVRTVSFHQFVGCAYDGRFIARLSAYALEGVKYLADAPDLIFAGHDGMDLRRKEVYPGVRRLVQEERPGDNITKALDEKRKRRLI